MYMTKAEGSGGSVLSSVSMQCRWGAGKSQVENQDIG